ncbi:MAG: T9SS type A sorting domain-containing protein [Bacteroidota bacterium]|nr:T9SS type A sorting domain-containing protein [Bacteroidota bacterium]
MNKKSLFFLAILVVSGMVFRNPVHSQKPVNDTASYPYWISMMMDPSVNYFKVRRAFDIYWKDRKITKGCGWKVFKRWEYMTRWRMQPDGTRLSPDATYSEYMNYAKAKRSQTGNWVSLGPSQIPLPGPAGYEGLGRLNVVAFHPTASNVLYVGSPSGGMWQSNDGGTTWVNRTDQNPTLGVSDIVIDKSNSQVIYLGTGDRDAGDASGMGVFKSTDGGLTWNVSNTGMGNQTVGKLIQHPSNSQILIAATSGGVYRTTNGGANWSKSLSGNFTDIKFKPNDPLTVYASGGSSFYRSSDNGMTFTRITSGLPSGQRGTIAVSPGNPSYVYFLMSNNSSGFLGLYRSTDSGLTFTARSTSPNILDWSCTGSDSGGQGWYDLSLAADPVNAETIYAGGIDVWKSTDGGSTWNIVSHWYGGCNVPAVHADCHFLGFNPLNNILYAGNDGGIWSSGNGGSAWTDHTVGLTIGQIYKLGQSRLEKDQVITGFQDNGSNTYMGTNWLSTGGGDGMECAVDYSDASYTYYTTYNGDIYRKHNNNNEVHVAGNGVNGITESGAWVTPFLLYPSDPNTMFAGYINIWRCRNIKATAPSHPVWVQISDNLAGNNSNNIAVLEESPADPNILYTARYDNKLFRTDHCMDDSPQWIDLTSSLPAAGTAADITAHPSDPNTVYIALGTKVYKSVNKGLSWTDISGNLPGIHINSIAYYKNAMEGLYVGTDAGVYYKDSDTNGWIPFSQGLPVSARVTELEIYYNSDTVANDAIRGSTYGRGLWSSDMYRSTPHAAFTASNTLIPPGCGIYFTDLSSGVPTQWNWSFPGGQPSSSSVKNPADIVYNTPGTYLVKEVIRNEYGQDSIVKTNYITVDGSLLPQADFTADRTGICIDDTVHLTDLSQACPGSWKWEFTPSSVIFVNGTSASSQNPSVVFYQPGPYSVKLTVTNSVGTSSLEKANYIYYGGYTIPFTENFEGGFDNFHWTILNPDGRKTWDTITTGGTTPGHISAWMNFFNNSAMSTRDQLISPALNFSGYPSASLNFQHAYAQRASQKDSLIVKISSDCGQTWTRIFAAGPNGTPSVFVTHAPDYEAFYPESAADWCGNGSYGVDCYSIDITPWVGNPDMKIMFESFNKDGNNLFLDNISITPILGIPEAGPSKEIRIYPNPSEGIFNLYIPSGFPKVSYQVFDLQGQKVLSGNTAPAGMTQIIDLSGFPKGMYYIQLISDHFVETRKIVEQ